MSSLGLLARATAAVVLVTALSSCRTPRRDALAPPRITVVEERLGSDGRACTAPASAVELVQGAVPPRARSIVRLRAQSARAVSLATIERLLVAHAMAHCADGLSVLRAQAPDGIDGVDDVTAVAWARPAVPVRGAAPALPETPGPSPPAAPHPQALPEPFDDAPSEAEARPEHGPQERTTR